ncbi:isoleucine--tRNA ligase [Patescibacteria group bacterium]|jgi:isoleucyl-tRNA synthetase|nr:isoleucine--tRNA ligase [Patescibacteria group bacterium]
MSDTSKSATGGSASGGPQAPLLPRIEEEILAYWKKHDIFRRSIEERPESKGYAFYDGPPFATGMPHHGNLLQSVIKDVVPRYWTMKGYRVPRVWGWDCHGLPVEALIQKELKLQGKPAIEEYGVAEFNRACANSVLKYAEEWKSYVERIGRWVEFDGAYKTMDHTFTESVWWAFAELWKKKLIYKGLRVSFFSPSNGTPLSNFEVAMENSYVDAEDPSVIVKFPVIGEKDTYFLAWTTTPWTLPANVALAVHPDEMYVKVRVHARKETYWFADTLSSKVLREYFPLQEKQNDFEILEKRAGSGLVGMSYEPPFVFDDATRERLTGRAGNIIYQVIAMDYVTIEDGTGIVHTAPAFGEEDFRASNERKLPVLVTLDDNGVQLPGVPLVAGMGFMESNGPIVKDLESRGRLFRSETVTHSVAIFARNNTRLIYKAQDAWYVDVTKLKPKMRKTAAKINWHPEHIKEGRFGKGIETAPDWCISRSRFWGAPLPVWTNADGTDVQVFGSIAELEKAAKQKINVKDLMSLHRPAVDEITFKNAKGEEMRRIPDVFDCWFESGSMPYASIHYPFENKPWFKANFPADFISEGQDQTRGWFYNLHVLSTALFGKPAFKDVTCTGLVLAEDGRKMSKSLKNYPDPVDVFNTHGADALRYYLMSSPVVEADSLNFSERDLQTIVRGFLNLFWNVKTFYATYAEGQSVRLAKPRSAHVLDRWMFARLNSVLQEVTEAMDGYELARAARPLRALVEDLSTWWLRRSRDRMKSENAFNRADALRTLYEVLLEMAKMLAPFTPFIAEKVYLDIGGKLSSVHLEKWSKSDARLIDARLLADMALVRSAASKGHEQRSMSKIPVRQALAAAIVLVKDAEEAARLMRQSDLMQLLAEELNVEAVRIEAKKDLAEDWTVELDTVITPELKRKGLRREFVRTIMSLRKEAHLEPSDRIRLMLSAIEGELRDALDEKRAEVLRDLKAEDISYELPEEETSMLISDAEVGGDKFRVAIEKMS